MSDIILSLLCTSAHIPSIILRYAPFSEKASKKQKKVLFLIYVIALSVNFLLCFYLQKNGGIGPTFYKLNLLLFCFVMAGVNMVVIKGYIREHLFTFGLVAIIVLLLLTTGAFFVETIGYNTLSQGLILTNIIIMVMFAVLYVPLRKLMNGTIKPFLNFRSEDYWKIIWFIPIAMFFASLFSVPFGEHISTVLQLISRLLVGLATLFICKSIATDYKRIIEKERMSRQIELQKQYYDALTEKVNAERKARHDFKHHIAVIRSFLNSDNKDELREYCETLELEQPGISEIPYTGNAAADGILFHYSSKAAEQKVYLEVNCRLSDVAINDVDLCILLGNALDNALTACCEYNGDKSINIASEKDGKTLVITVDNSFDGVILKDGDKILSKKRTNEEGIGISSMRHICEKYGGTCRFAVNGNRFEASFILQM